MSKSRKYCKCLVDITLYSMLENILAVTSLQFLILLTLIELLIDLRFYVPPNTK